jgi:hypothetical protein
MRSKFGVSAHVHVGSIQATNPLVPIERPKGHHVTAAVAVHVVERGRTTTVQAKHLQICMTRLGEALSKPVNSRTEPC